MKLWYSKWKTQKGEAITVSPLEFIEYYKVNKVIHTWEDGDKMYEGQIFKCRLEDGSIKKLPFRVEVVDKESYSSNTSLPINKNPIKENTPNPITDSWEECTLGIISKDLFPRLDLLGKYIMILTEIENKRKYKHLKEAVEIRFNLQKADSEQELKKEYNKYLELDKEIKAEIKSLIYHSL